MKQYMLSVHSVEGSAPAPPEAAQKAYQDVAAFNAELDHFLTARWRLFSSAPSGLRYADVEHAPWPLYRVQVLEVDDRLLAATGLPSPATEPIAHFSPGVDVRIGMPHRVGV